MAIGKGLLLAGVGLGGLLLAVGAKGSTSSRIIGKTGTEYYTKPTTLPDGKKAVLVYVPGKQFGSSQDMYVLTYVMVGGVKTLQAWNTGAPTQMVSNAMTDLTVKQPKKAA